MLLDVQVKPMEHRLSGQFKKKQLEYEANKDINKYVYFRVILPMLIPDEIRYKIFFIFIIFI